MGGIPGLPCQLPQLTDRGGLTVMGRWRRWPSHRGGRQQQCDYGQFIAGNVPVGKWRTSWSFASNGLPQFLGTVEIDPSNDKIVYVGTVITSSTIYYKGRRKVVEADHSGLPTGMVARVIRVDPNNSNTVYCGTDLGVFRTTDQGLTWSRFGTGLPNASVTDLRITADGSIIRIATFGRGIWRCGCRLSTTHPRQRSTTRPAQ